MNRPPFHKLPMTSHHPAGPQYNDYEQPDRNEFWRARSQIVTMWRQITILLDTAGTNDARQITGDFIFCDSSSTGIATVEFNNQTNVEGGGFQVGPGWFHKGPFTLAKFSWTAQPGKVIKLLYATGLEAYPGTAGFTINGTTQVTEMGSTYGASFASSTSLAGATNEVILAPASNVNGLIVWSASMSTAQNVAASASLIGLIAKASAPASSTDGDVLLTLVEYAITAAGVGSSNVIMPRPYRVAAGKGLYFRNSATAETAGYRSLQYTIL